MGSTLQHHLNCRWRHGYGAVTQVPAWVTVTLEELERELSRTPAGEVVISVRELPGIGTVGSLACTPYLRAESRYALWHHSLVASDRSVSPAWMQEQFHAIYGPSPLRTVHILYTLLAALDRWDVDPLVRDILFGGADEHTPFALRAGALADAVLRRWPESLRELVDVGADELEALRAQSAGQDLREDLRLDEAVTPRAAEDGAPAAAPPGEVRHTTTAPMLPAPSGAQLAATPEDTDPEPPATDEVDPLGLAAPEPAGPEPTQAQPSRPTPSRPTPTQPPPPSAPAAPLAAPGRRPTPAGRWAAAAMLILILLFTWLAWPSPEAPPPGAPHQVAPEAAAQAAAAVASPSPAQPPPVAQPSPAREPGTQPPDGLPTPAGPAPEVQPSASPAPPPQPRTAPPGPCLVDADRDGFPVEVEAAPAGSQCGPFNTKKRDCDDTHPNIKPGGKVLCDGNDNNCDKVDDCLGGGNPPEDRSKRAGEYILLAVRDAGCPYVRADFRFDRPGAKANTVFLKTDPKGQTASCKLPLLDDHGLTGVCVPKDGSSYVVPREDRTLALSLSWSCCAASDRDTCGKEALPVNLP